MQNLSKSEIVSKYADVVRVVVKRLLSSNSISRLPIEIEDLYQIGWVTLLKCQSSFDPDRNVKFETYASRAIERAVLLEIGRQMKRKMINATIEIEAGTPFGEAIEFMNWLTSRMYDENILDKEERDVFWSRFLDDETFKEIGEKLSVSKETARQIYNRSLEKIKRAYVNEH